ncbi:hypothetical protein D9M71_492970 [compost metagenome]
MGNARGGQVIEQRQRVVNHMLVHLPCCRVYNVHQLLGNFGKERAAVTATHEAFEECLIGGSTQALAQYLANKGLQVFAHGPRAMRVAWDIDNDPPAGVEQPALVQHLQH